MNSGQRFVLSPWFCTERRSVAVGRNPRTESRSFYSHFLAAQSSDWPLMGIGESSFKQLLTNILHYVMVALLPVGPATATF